MDDPEQPTFPPGPERAQPEMPASASAPIPADSTAAQPTTPAGAPLAPGAAFTPTPYPPTPSPSPSPFAPMPYAGVMSGPVPPAPPAYPAPTYADPAYPPYPTYPTYPSFPPYAPTPYAGVPYVPTLPHLSPLPPARPPWLARAMPGAVPPILALWALSLLAGAAILGLVVTQGEWADASRFAAVAGIALGTICLLGLLIRFIGGYRARQGLLLGLAAVVVLGALAATGLRLVQPLYASQARAFEASHNYARALENFRLTGARAPNSRDLARVYDEWGEQLAQQGDYAGAVTDFHLVRDTYYGATVEVDRAWADLLRTDVAWLGRDGASLSYETELTMLSDLTGEQGRVQCDATCKATLATALPENLYLLGEQVLAQQNYSQAITYFEQVQSQYKSSPYAKKAHAGAATAYYALGQTQLTDECATAVPTYKTLASTYADTPEGAKAKAALAAGVTVTGTVQNLPYANATMYLSSYINGGFFGYFSDDYSTTVDAANHFTFHNVAPGQYDVSFPLDGGQINWYFTSNQSPYTVSVGPLCPVDAGTYSYH